MKSLLLAWRSSLEILKPSKLGGFFRAFLVRYGKGTWLFLKVFGGVLLLDASIQFFLGDIVSKAVLLVKLGQTKSLSQMLLYMILSLISFILMAGYFLCIRKGRGRIPGYFRLYFFRYVQLCLYGALFMFLGINILISLGIRVLPKAPLVFSYMLRLFEVVIAFYWLDSEFTFRDLLISLEKTVNALLYNLPFFVIVGVLWFSVDYGVGKGAMSLQELVGEGQPYVLSSFATCLKYVIFFIHFLFISILFSFYSKKKWDIYSGSYFE